MGRAARAVAVAAGGLLSFAVRTPDPVANDDLPDIGEVRPTAPRRSFWDDLDDLVDEEVPSTAAGGRRVFDVEFAPQPPPIGLAKRDGVTEGWLASLPAFPWASAEHGMRARSEDRVANDYLPDVGEVLPTAPRRSFWDDLDDLVDEEVSPVVGGTGGVRERRHQLFPDEHLRFPCTLANRRRKARFRKALRDILYKRCLPFDFPGGAPIQAPSTTHGFHQPPGNRDMRLTSHASVVALRRRYWAQFDFFLDPSARARLRRWCGDLAHRLTQFDLLEAQTARLPELKCPAMQVELDGEMLSEAGYQSVRFLNRFRRYVDLLQHALEGAQLLYCSTVAFQVSLELMSEFERDNVARKIGGYFNANPAASPRPPSHAEMAGLLFLGWYGYPLVEVQGTLESGKSAMAKGSFIQWRAMGLELTKLGCAPLSPKALLVTRLGRDAAPGQPGRVHGPDGFVTLTVPDVAPAGGIAFVAFRVPAITKANLRLVFNRYVFRASRHGRQDRRAGDEGQDVVRPCLTIAGKFLRELAADPPS